MSNFFIPIVPSALTDIFNITPFKNPFNYEVCLGIIINLLKVHIPENALFKYRFLFYIHATKIINSDDRFNSRIGNF